MWTAQKLVPSMQVWHILLERHVGDEISPRTSELLNSVSQEYVSRGSNSDDVGMF